MPGVRPRMWNIPFTLFLKYGILSVMRRKVEKKLITDWARSVGGTGRAAKMLMEATEIAPATADKLVRGCYVSEPQFLIRKACCELTGIPEDRLFPFVSAKGRAS